MPSPGKGKITKFFRSLSSLDNDVIEICELESELKYADDVSFEPCSQDLVTQEMLNNTSIFDYKFWESAYSSSIENTDWSRRFKPTTALQCLGNSLSAEDLQSWMRRNRLCRAKKHKNNTEDDESNFMVCLVYGPHGSGKTSSVYAVAAAIGFEVFEINSGTRRGGKEITEMIGELSRNYMVTAENGKKRSRQTREAVILIDEADICFDEDKGFWSAIDTLSEKSQRPIVLTMSDRFSVRNAKENHKIGKFIEFYAVENDLKCRYLQFIMHKNKVNVTLQSIKSLLAGSNLGQSIRQTEYLSKKIFAYKPTETWKITLDMPEHASYIDAIKIPNEYKSAIEPEIHRDKSDILVSSMKEIKMYNTSYPSTWDIIVKWKQELHDSLKHKLPDHCKCNTEKYLALFENAIPSHRKDMDTIEYISKVSAYVVAVTNYFPEKGARKSLRATFRNPPLPLTLAEFYAIAQNRLKK